MIRKTVGEPWVSCVLIFLDGARFIEEAIASVVGQAGFDDWELILVDDGSTDASTEMAKTWAASDPARIRYVEHQGHQNRGMSESRNLGVSVAHGVYVAFLDSDDIWLPSALAHRMRVATAYPEAEVVVGGTWRWYSWTDDDADRAADRRMALPNGPPYTPLRPPRLFSAIYGVPGGGQVPAMCSLLVRREALLALGGLEAQFRGLYEDQILYVKAGLQLTAVIDPRSLALYRQHPGSACEMSIANGAWSVVGPSPSATRFFDWMQSYVCRETGPRSEESKIVERNIVRNRTPPDQLDRGWRAFLTGVTPQPLRTVVRRFRRWRTSTQDSAVPVSVLGEWSAQHLRVITASLTGSVLVVAPTHPSREPWASEIPDDAFRAASHVDVSPLDEVDTAASFDHIVVPFDATVSVPIEALFRALESLLRRPGTIVALVPGPAYRNGLSGRATGTRGSDGASDLALRARRQIAQAHVSTETFGNAVTAEAVAAGTPASEVDGVAIDLHDPRTPVMVALHVSVSDLDQPDARISRRREGTDGDRTAS